MSVIAKCTVRGRFRYRISDTVRNRGNFTYRSVPFRRRRNSYTAYTVRDLQFFLYRSIPFQPTPLYRSLPLHTVPYRSCPPLNSYTAQYRYTRLPLYLPHTLRYTPLPPLPVGNPGIPKALTILLYNSAEL